MINVVKWNYELSKLQQHNCAEKRSSLRSTVLSKRDLWSVVFRILQGLKVPRCSEATVSEDVLERDAVESHRTGNRNSPYYRDALDSRSCCQLSSGEILWQQVQNWASFWYVTDGYKVYPRFVDPSNHLVSKTYMTRVENENSRLRHYLARLPQNILLL